MNSANFSDDELLPSSESSSTLTRKSTRSTNPAPSNAILKAYQITAYKYVNDKYESKGKLGLALLGSKQNRNFNILIYSKGSNPVCQVNINGDFNVYSSKEQYVTFYDHKAENWSLYFDMYDSYKDFVNRICIYKFLASKNEFLPFDVKIGEGSTCNDNDLCEVEIFVCTIVNAEIVSTLYSTSENESKMIRLKLGSNKLLPIIDKCTVGMAKGGIRIISVSNRSNLIKTNAINIPPDTDLLVQIRLVRYKSKVERSMVNLPEISDSEIGLPNLNVDRQHDQENSGLESKKSELISRMSKMGKPIMGLTATSDNIYESPTIHSSKPSNAHSVSYLSNLDYTNTPLTTMGSTQMLPYSSNSHIFSNYAPNVSAIPHIPNAPINNDFNILFTETRQNNTETRIALSKLQDKVEKIIENLDKNASNVIQRSFSSRHMDAEVVYENIKRIIDENESLKNECSEKNTTINSLNNKINELFKSSQRYLDDSHNMIERNSISFNSSVTEHQNKILELEEEKLKYIRSLSQKTSELSQLQMKLDASSADVIKLKTQSVEYSEQLTKLTEEYDENKLKTSNLIMEINQLKDIRKTEFQKQSELEALKDKYEDSELKNQQKIEDLKKTINQINEKSSKIRAEYDSEIAEIRDQHNQELAEVKQKLKQERLKATSKSSDLDNEIESLNRNWEEKFEEFRKAESVKTTKLAEKNRSLMVENSGLNRELLELRETVNYSNVNSFSELESMRSRNKQMLQELNESQAKLTELSSIQYTNEVLETENIQLKNQISKLQEFQLKNVQLSGELEETKSKLLGQTQAFSDSNLEISIRKIMNGIFKKLKDDFESNESYDGRVVLNKCMIIIRDSTIAYINHQQVTVDDEESDEESEEISDDNDEETENYKENDTENLLQLKTEEITSTMKTEDNSEMNLEIIDCLNQTEFLQTADILDSENDTKQNSMESVSYDVDEETDVPSETIIYHDDDKNGDQTNIISNEKNDEVKDSNNMINKDLKAVLSTENNQPFSYGDTVNVDISENLVYNKNDELENKTPFKMNDQEIHDDFNKADSNENTAHSVASEDSKLTDDFLPSKTLNANQSNTAQCVAEVSTESGPDPVSFADTKKQPSSIEHLNIDSSDDDNDEFFHNLTKKSIETKATKQIQETQKDKVETIVPKGDYDDDLNWLN